MLFPKGPRFEPQKIPDVPGPNTYNMDQESHIDAYKRGAFLEKADRFNKDKPSDVPGPGGYNMDAKPHMKSSTASGPKHSAAERYAALQRKLEDLERMHAEGKKSHQAEVERLKLEANRSRQVTTDQADRLEKLKKQNDTFDVRIQELKKAASADQNEIKELRVKLRMSEHERTQLATKQGEAGETKKALHMLESKRREELRERDKKITELERAVAMEKKKREGADARSKEVKAKADEEIQQVRQAIQDSEGRMDEAQAEARRAQSSLTIAEGQAKQKEEELVAQLEQCRAILARVAEEYGRLASVTVSSQDHSRLKQEHVILNIRTLRVERKLANSEGQVVELANLVRHVKEQNTFLSEQLRDAQDAAAFYSQALKDASQAALLHHAVGQRLDQDIAVIDQELRESGRHMQDHRLSDSELCCEYYRLNYGQLLFHYSVQDKALAEEQQIVQRQSAELSEATTTCDSLASQLDALRTEHENAQQQLATATANLQDARADNETIQRRMQEVDAQMQAEAAKNKEALHKEREVAQRAAAAAQIAKMSEVGLRAEVEQLTTELTDAERYQEAYYGLVDEVDALVDRNNLAEEEADRLSKFNAEILGHNNPAQRIMYVDRIRRELAEAKHNLLLLTRDRDAVAVNNEDLRQELDMYKSVMVPSGDKPRTNITRIGRPALASQNLNVDATTKFTKSFNDGGERKVQMQTLGYIPGDMTLEEIM